MLSEIHMYMRFMVLSDVSKQHVNFQDIYSAAMQKDMR